MFHIASSKGPPEIPQHLSPECKDFLYLCFNRDWKARPAASTLLRHPFLADVVVRSQAGPSPNAVALAHVWRTQQPAGRGASGSAAGLEGSDGQFGTPSPLHPKVAAAQAGLAGGAARISLQADTTEGDGTVALSPLGAHAATKQQWDSAAAPQQQQPQRRQGAFPAAPQPGGRAYSGSPVKRPAMSLRASAPAFSGYASVALSQQPEQLSPPLVRPPAPQQPMGSGQLRNSRDSGSTALHSTAVAHTASQELPRSGSQQQLAQEASAATLSPLEDEPAAELEAPAEEVAAGVSKTPAVERQRPGVQDLMAAEPSGAAGTSPGTADSAGNSSGTHKVCGRCGCCNMSERLGCGSLQYGSQRLGCPARLSFSFLHPVSNLCALPAPTPASATQCRAITTRWRSLPGCIPRSHLWRARARPQAPSPPPRAAQRPASTNGCRRMGRRLLAMRPRVVQHCHQKRWPQQQRTAMGQQPSRRLPASCLSYLLAATAQATTWCGPMRMATLMLCHGTWADGAPAAAASASNSTGSSSSSRALPQQRMKGRSSGSQGIQWMRMR